MHTITILRDYMGISQTEMAKRAKLTQPDISEMEHRRPYGQIAKYQRLAAELGTTVHSLVMNNIKDVPLSFFEKNPEIRYAEVPVTGRMILGRQGEELAFQMEKDRLKVVSSAMSKLVLPYFKMKGFFPGYDILSYQEDGTPIFIEVKTSESNDQLNFQLTKHEYESAVAITNEGYKYYIYHFTAWGTSRQQLQIYDFQDMIKEDRISPVKYVCNLRDKSSEVNGIVYFRRLMNITQKELSLQTGIPTSSLCKYELGTHIISVSASAILAEFFQVTIDQLLQMYTISEEFDSNEICNQAE